MSNTILEAIEGVAKSFEELKKTNDQMLLEERKGNEARARELKDTLDKISEDLDQKSKDKEILERKLATQQERLEILEAVNTKPGKTMGEKIKDEYKTAFMKWMRSGGADRDAEHEAKSIMKKGVEAKVIAVGSGADGGLAVPEEISRAIDKYVLKMSEIVANVKNVQVGTSDYVELISVNDLGTGWSTESGSRSAKANPELVSRTPTWGELYTLPSAYNWALEDIFFDVENWLLDNASEAFAVALSTAIYSGNGSGQPTGMFNGAPVSTDDYASPRRAAGVIEYLPITASSSPFTTNGFGVDDMVDLVYGLRRPYHTGAKFAMNRATIGHVRKLKDSNGQYLWQPSVQAGQPDMILGYPVFVWEDLLGATTLNAYPVVFGDFRRAYTLVTRTGLSVLRDPYSTKGSTAFYIARRYGGIVTNNSAVKCLKVALS